MTYNVRNIAIALVLGRHRGVPRDHVHGERSEAGTQLAAGPPRCWIATGDIPAGTSVADAISGGQLQQRKVVQQDVIVGALTDEKALDSS